MSKLIPNSDDVISLYDCKRAGHCVAGVKQWCKEHNYPWHKMCWEGFPLREAEKLDERPVQHIIAVKKGHMNGRQQQEKA